jgi:hypothetical protein
VQINREKLRNLLIIDVSSFFILIELFHHAGQ